MRRTSDGRADRETFLSRYGPWAVVTGGAEGMGAAFAEELAGCGSSLCLVDRQADKLAATAKRLENEYGVSVRTVSGDLSVPDTVEALFRETQALDVGMVVSCAAFGQVGPFLDADESDLLRAVDVNVRVPLRLAHHYGRSLKARGRGGMVLLASDAAYHGSPFCANYAATKSFSLVLGESLWYELRSAGVDVMSFVPGPTNTPGFRRASPKLKEGQRVPGVMLPSEVAAAAIESLGAGPSALPNRRLAAETFFATRVLDRKRAVTRMGDRLSVALRPTDGRNATPRAKDEENR